MLRERIDAAVARLNCRACNPLVKAYNVDMNPFLLPVGFCCALWLCCAGCSPKAPTISLTQAIETGNLKAVQQHVAAKSDLNQLDSAGWAPLHLATLKGNLAMVEVLSAGGADLNRKSKYGKTPLDVARAKNLTAIVQFFQQQTEKNRGGRGLIDGGLGVSDAMDNM